MILCLLFWPGVTPKWSYTCPVPLFIICPNQHVRFHISAVSTNCIFVPWCFWPGVWCTSKTMTICSPSATVDSPWSSALFASVIANRNSWKCLTVSIHCWFSQRVNYQGYDVKDLFTRGPPYVAVDPPWFDMLFLFVIVYLDQRGSIKGSGLPGNIWTGFSLLSLYLSPSPTRVWKPY